MTNNIVLSKSINGTTYQVTIFTTRVEDVISKPMTSFTPPQSTANQVGSDPDDTDFGPKDTWIIDLLMLTRRLNVDGYIADETLPVSSPDTYSGGGDTPGSQTAQIKRSNLKYIFYAGGTFSLTYDGVVYVVGMDKLSIMDNAADESTALQYNVKFTAVEGIDMPARS